MAENRTEGRARDAGPSPRSPEGKGEGVPDAVIPGSHQESRGWRKVVVSGLAAVSLSAGIYAALAFGGQLNPMAIGMLLAFAGGLLSTWSPCGYSSLSLLRPQGQYSLSSVLGWLPTLGAHALGYAAGAVLLGGLLGLGALLLPTSGLSGTGLVTVGALAIAYGLHSFGMLPLPYPQRKAQVPHDIRNRGVPMWQISLLYGFSLGLNFLTYVRTPVIYAVVAMALVSGSVTGALLLIGALNLGRFAPMLGNAFPVRDATVQHWLASHEENSVLVDGTLLAATGAAFLLLGLG